MQRSRVKAARLTRAASSPVSSPKVRLLHVHAKHRHHRARRSWQDHPRRSAPGPVRHLPRERSHDRARHGLQRPGARARDHHPGQVHLRAVERRGRRNPDQHHRHPRPRRLRRRGRAHPRHGGRLRHPGGRRRRRHAPDQVRAGQGPEDGPASRSSASTRWTAPTPTPTASSTTTFDLFAAMGATDEQLDFPHIYAFGQATAGRRWT